MKKDTQQPEWLNEPDAGELQEMATLLKESYTNSLPDDALPYPDVEQEWQSFAQQHTRSKKHLVLKKWAVAASILLVSLVGYAAYQALSLSQRDTSVQAEREMPLSDNTLLSEPHSTSTDFIYGDASLQLIVNELAAYHKAEVKVERDVTGIRLHTQLSKQWTLAECVAFLNKFEQVNLELQQNCIVVK